MRAFVLALLFALLSGHAGALHADEDPPAEMTEAERAAALKKAEELERELQALHNQGSTAAAVPLAREALALREAALGPKHRLVADSLHYLAAVLRSTGAYESAIPLMQRANGIREELLGAEHPHVAVGLSNLAVLFQTLGQVEQAMPYLERALEIQEKTFGADHPNVATTLGNLGFSFQTLGQYARARALFERASAIWEAALGAEHPQVAASLTRLGALLRSVGQYGQARPLFERAYAILEKTHGAGHPHLVETLSNLAALCMAERRYDEAQALFECTLRIRMDSLGGEHPKTARSMSNLVWLFRATEQYDAALRLQERALEIQEGALGSGHPYVADSLSNLAGLFRATGQHGRAIAVTERMLDVREGAFGPDHLSVAEALHDLALSLWATGQDERATNLFRRCLDIVERWIRRHFTGLLATERLALARTLRGHLDQWLHSAPSVDGSAYGDLLRFKGLVARATAAERRLARAVGAEAAARVTVLRRAERTLSRLANSMPPYFQKEKRKSWQHDYARAAATREDLARALARDFAPFRAERERLDLRLTDVQRALPPGAVLVDVLRSRKRYLAWVIRREGAPQRFDLGDSQVVEEAVVEFAELAAAWGGDAADANLRAAGQRLRDMVLTPLAAQIGEGVDTLIICPDAALAAVPFAALPGRKEGDALADDYLVVQVSMAQDLVPRKAAHACGEGVVAVGAVDYHTASATVERQLEARSRGAAALDRAPRGGRFGRLPQTGVEVRHLETLLGDRCLTLTDAHATEARLRMAVKGRRILHLATHGFVRDDLMRGLHRRESEQEWLGTAQERQLAAGHDPLNLAGLAMAGANPREGGHGDDGILSAAEASYLDLDGVDLVVLSACETALGRAESGEGVIGLVQGFQMAGAKRVIASLWKVDDEATRLLMQHLYDGMLRKENPLSPAGALRAAQLEVRNSTGESGRSFAHPRFWAGFICYGR